MGITANKATLEEELKDTNAYLRAQVYNLHAELDHYRDENKNPSWLQSKIMRQAKALTGLNRRVRVQRLILRELNEIHPEIAETLFRMVSDKYSTELDDDIVLKF